MTGTEQTVLICGDRKWCSHRAIEDVIRALPKGATVIHGGARGADTIAGMAAHFWGLKVIAVHANWKTYGRRAGVLRNLDMLDMKPDLVIAFHHNLERSRGTRHCVREALRRGIPVDTVGCAIPQEWLDDACTC